MQNKRKLNPDSLIIHQHQSWSVRSNIINHHKYKTFGVHKDHTTSGGLVFYILIITPEEWEAKFIVHILYKLRVSTP